MVLSVFSVLDKKVDYMRPFFEQTDDAARRAFMVSLSSSPTPEFNADYDLYRIGEFDTTTGEIVGYKPVFICAGYIKPVKVERQEE